MGREQEKSGRRVKKKIEVFLTVLCKMYKVRYLKVAKVTFSMVPPREKLSPDILLYINV